MNDDEFQDIQRLIRLKRHESPGEGFTEEFLKRFHQRQREEKSRQTSLERLWEGLSMRFEELFNPRWALAGAAAALVLLGAWLFMPAGSGDGSHIAKDQPKAKSDAADDPLKAVKDPNAVPVSGQGSEAKDPNKATQAVHDGTPGTLGH